MCLISCDLISIVRISFPAHTSSPIKKQKQNTSRHTLYTQCQDDEMEGFKIECLLILDTKGKTGKTNVTFSKRRATSNVTVFYQARI